MGKTPWGHIHHPPPPPSRALYPRREAPACVRPELCAAGRAPRERALGDARADPRATSPSRWAAPGGQDLRGSPPALLSCGRFAAERRAPKMRLRVRFGVSSPHRAPDRPAPLRPVRGRPGRALAAGAARGPAVYAPCARPSSHGARCSWRHLPSCRESPGAARPLALRCGGPAAGGAGAGQARTRACETHAPWSCWHGVARAPSHDAHESAS